MYKLSTVILLLCLLVACGAGESFEDSAPDTPPSAPSDSSFPEATLPNVPNKRSYTVELKRWDIDNTGGSDTVKTTDNLQAAIDWAAAEGYGEIRIPAGKYLLGKYGNDIYQRGIELPSDTALILDDDAVMQMASNDKWNYCLIAVTEKTNVVIRGGTLIGDRDSHIYTPRPSDGKTVHDEGHLICIQNESQYVLVEDVTLSKANGDGILLVGQKGEGSSVKDITIRNNEFSYNRRQGISVVGGVRILIHNNEIHHTSGTPPQFGIDIESLKYESRDIIIRQNTFHNNRGGDIVNTDGKNVLIEYNTLEQGEDSQYIDGPIVYWKRGDMTVRHNTIQMTDPSVNVKAGIIMYSNSQPKTNPATTYIYNNVCQGCGFHMYLGADLVVKDNELIDGYLSFRDMANLTLEGNKVSSHSSCWAFRLKNVTGRAGGNTYNGDAFELPLGSKPFTKCWQ